MKMPPRLKVRGGGYSNGHRPCYMVSTSQWAEYEQEALGIVPDLIDEGFRCRRG